MGAGSVLALGGSYYEFNVSRSPEEADARAPITLPDRNRCGAWVVSCEHRPRPGAA